ncbi:MAG TPA: NAD(P)/FAD-dependent oxidoreductase [Verrucomicrobiota bacterium]|nr:NAD(P)/FAD-dependent oxidoreductase [Verrucomicrobiota bacterium]HNT14769.1 NAD(P)/FAD-dependent oxidoreductase [Verrucomicrobiota bacterium]
MSGHHPVQVVVLGAGFGGLTFCQHFRHPDARLTVVDRTNHHLFQPLLYQVAACGLSATEIAQPVRSILSKRRDITVLFNRVVGIDLQHKQVRLAQGELSYDYLVLALGGQTSYFGHPEWEQFAPGLKTLADALRIRSQILLAFEQAENATDPQERDRLMTIVVVGGGPTGVELAGAFAELARTVLNRDFRRIDPSKARIILIEGSPLVLSHLPAELSASAQRQLTALGVQIHNNIHVQAIRAHEVELADGRVIRAGTIIWAAGVAASPLAGELGVELDRGGRIKVAPDLSLPGHPEVFAIGDMVSLLQPNGQPVPGVSPAAMQMGRHVAVIIKAELNSPRGPTARPPFQYWDKGTMATIGRSAAVAWIGRFRFSGLLAWLTWLFVHLIFLVGFRNRLAVLFQWAYSYFAYKRSARIITYLPGAAADAGSLSARTDDA